MQHMVLHMCKLMCSTTKLSCLKGVCLKARGSINDLACEDSMQLGYT